MAVQAVAVAARSRRQVVGNTLASGQPLRLPLLLVALVAAGGAQFMVAAYDYIQVPIRPPTLPLVPRVVVPADGVAPVVMKPTDVSIYLDAATNLRFNTPRYVTPGVNDLGLQSPALVLDAICRSFSIELTNQLPFQQYHTCPAGGEAFANGPKNFQWTNLHTHGLKVEPGATNVSNLCEPGFPTAGLPANITLIDYYCSNTTSSAQLCRVRADNVLVTDRPLTAAATGNVSYGVAQHPGATIKYTYPLQALTPGIAWYHPHVHGSVGVQTPTSGAPLIIPESSLPGGLTDLYRTNGKINTDECNRLLDVMGSMPLEKSTILQINGIWFRNTTVPDTATPDDDSLPFLGSAGVGPEPFSSLLYDPVTGEPLYDNTAGRDWALINGAFQPTIKITASRYSRWQLLNTMTMKWLDLTIQKINLTDSSLTPADSCKFWLLGRDGVPLPKVPRLLRSTPPSPSSPPSSPSSPPVGPFTSSSRGNNINRAVSDIILGPANRADVLVKCEVPGTYVLASGAGPFNTHRDACRATHCECFGDRPANAAVLRSANNLYGGRELNAAVLAVVEVQPLLPGSSPQSDFANQLCMSRLDRYSYLDYLNFPKPPAPTQCFSFMNQAYGGFCSVNNQLFPDGVAYVEQGSQQLWNIRDITFHPFHLHETPVRITKLPPCSTNVTNNWQVGDFMDTILLPTCQTGCNWGAVGGTGTCGAPASTCDETTIQWLATSFSAPVQPYARDACRDFSFNATNTKPALPCRERVSVFHCHVLPHEDEGCMALVVWYCPGFTPPASAYPAQCPATYTLDCLGAAAGGTVEGRRPHHRLSGRRLAPPA